MEEVVVTLHIALHGVTVQVAQILVLQRNQVGFLLSQPAQHFVGLLVE